MVSLYTRFCSSILFPLHERLKGRSTLRALRELEATQWWPAERLAELRYARLLELLGRAQTDVPYYHDVFARIGFDVREFRSLSDLQHLPLLTKSDIRTNVERLKSARARGLLRFNTGGSSGEPLVFFVGSERLTRNVAAKWRATRWWAVDIGDPEVVVWGSPIELGAQDRLRSLRDRLIRSRLLPAFEMSEANLARFVSSIRAMRPRMLFGYPSSIARIAQYGAEHGERLDNLGIKVAFVTAERLYDDQRQAIEAAFGCRVANGYGGRDAGFVAHECPAGGMHISAEDIIVETVGTDGRPTLPGEAGEIVVTHLATHDFPFIRYCTGDVAVLDDRPCACGRTLPLIREIQGRSTDFVVAADGTVMHGLALIYVVRELPGVAAFRIVQETLDRTRVELVPGPGFDPGVAAHIREGFRARLGPQVDIVVEPVSAIAREKSGKFRYVVSNVHA